VFWTRKGVVKLEGILRCSTTFLSFSLCWGGAVIKRDPLGWFGPTRDLFGLGRVCIAWGVRSSG